MANSILVASPYLTPIFDDLLGWQGRKNNKGTIGMKANWQRYVLWGGFWLLLGCLWQQGTALAASQQKTLAFFEAANMRESFKNNAAIAADVAIKSAPLLAKHRKELEAFYDKYLSYDRLKNDLVAIYSQHFTDAELDALIQFYQTDVGQKSLKILPKLTQESMELGQRIVKQNIHELLKVINQSPGAITPSH